MIPKGVDQMITTVAIIVVILIGTVITLAVKSSKNGDDTKVLKAEILSLQDQLDSQMEAARSLTQLVDSLNAENSSLKIDIGRYEYAIDQMDNRCKTQIENILSHSE
jgi:predicted RNase H-like nuclease (RuvC/YqgF family)